MEKVLIVIIIVVLLLVLYYTIQQEKFDNDTENSYLSSLPQLDLQCEKNIDLSPPKDWAWRPGNGITRFQEREF